jgi:hypothetical protein
MSSPDPGALISMVLGPGMVAHARNLSYLEGRDRRLAVTVQLRQNCEPLCQKKTKKNQNNWGTAQV